MSAETPKYQYQRAYALSKDLSDQLLSFSTEQINQLKTQNAIVQRATEAAQRVSTVASTSYGAAQEKVHAVSDVMLQELQKVQVITRILLLPSALTHSSFQQSTAALPSQLQSSFNDISVHLSTTITDISTILTSPDPLNEKVHKVRDTVQSRVTPLLEATSIRMQEILDSVRGKAAEAEHEVVSASNGQTNGRA